MVSVAGTEVEGWRTPSRSSLRVVGVSDDFTGAASAAGEFGAFGLRAEVRGWEAAASCLHDSTSVVLLDTASRLLPADGAARRISEAMRACAPTGNEGFYYKRIDSRLRGQVVAELRAVTEEVAQPLVVACAAPRLGVHTQGGVQYAAGRRVDASDSSDAPHEITPSARLSDLLPGPSTVLDTGALHDPGMPVLIRGLLRRGLNIICDGDHVRDLERIAQVLVNEHLLDQVTPVGTYGFGGALAAAVVRRTRPTRPGILVVVGSVHKSTRAQVQLALRCDRALITCAEIRDGGDGVADRVAASLAAGSDVLLVSQPLKSRQTPVLQVVRYAFELAQAACEVIRRATPRAVVLVGGELASTMLRLSGARWASIEAEPWPATPVLRFQGGLLHGVSGIVKSGTHGEAAWMDQALSFISLREEQRDD